MYTAWKIKCSVSMLSVEVNVNKYLSNCLNPLLIKKKESHQYVFPNSSHSCLYRQYRTYRRLTVLYNVQLVYKSCVNSLLIITTYVVYNSITVTQLRHSFVITSLRKLPSICSYWLEGKPQKKPQPGNLPRPGIEPGPPSFAATRANRYSTGVDFIFVTVAPRYFNFAFVVGPNVMSKQMKLWTVFALPTPPRNPTATEQECVVLIVTRNRRITFPPMHKFNFVQCGTQTGQLKSIAPAVMLFPNRFNFVQCGTQTGQLKSIAPAVMLSPN
ncbi:hypothetical protein ANN_02266, partial [Periplaneta americana]